MLEGETSLVAKIVALYDAFDQAAIGHAFGGALALAYYTAEPRATADIDANVHLDGSDALAAFVALPPEVGWTNNDVQRAARDDQVRLWWGRTPIDLFFRASQFHLGVGARTVRHRFAGRDLPFLSANDLAVFKALFDRPKDWVDIESMVSYGALDTAWVSATLVSLIGDDLRAQRMRDLGVGL